jgi:hypothetical protein
MTNGHTHTHTGGGRGVNSQLQIAKEEGKRRRHIVINIFTTY